MLLDAEKLQQIVLNLLTNAVKFTNSGGTVELSVERLERSVAVHVTDSRDLARGMGGELSIGCSAEGVGSTFTLTLPSAI